MGPPHLGMFDQNVGGGGMLQQGIPLQQQGMGLAGMAPQGMAPVQGQVTGISYPAPRGVAPGGFLPTLPGTSHTLLALLSAYFLASGPTVSLITQKV